jgi:hypothetical protein
VCSQLVFQRTAAELTAEAGGRRPEASTATKIIIVVVVTRPAAAARPEKSCWTFAITMSNLAAVARTNQTASGGQVVTSTSTTTDKGAKITTTTTTTTAATATATSNKETGATADIRNRKKIAIEL